MATTGAGVRPDVTLKLSQLQNLCKRDPQGHRSDYDAQIRRLQSECHILSLSPSAKPPPQLSELIQFAAAVSSSSYDTKTSDMVSNLLVCLLLGKSYDAATEEESHQNASDGDRGNKKGKHGNKSFDNFTFTSVVMSLPTSALNLHRDVRKSCVSALILMRNKGKLPPLKLLELFFRIMAVIADKGLREQVYKHIVNDVRNINKKGKRHEAVNRNVQSFLHKVVGSTVRNKKNNPGGTGGEVDDATQFAAKKAVDMTAELYRRRVWTDVRTVAVLASGVESTVPNVAAVCMRFFLGVEEKMANDEERQENDEWNSVQQIDFHVHSRKTKKRSNKIGKKVKTKVKEQKKRESELDTTDYGVELSRKLYPAIELLRDPQGLAESVLKRIQKTGANAFRFEYKLLALNFLTRLVGNHELMLLSLYPFLRRYMGGHQRDVTQILTYTVQSCHEQVPPEEVHGLLKTIAHNFITERCSGEQIAVGINACRAICARVPSSLVAEDSKALDDDDCGGGSTSITIDVEAFARDLAGYAKHRDRSVAVAGRSWTNFVREVYSSLLQGKDRGKTGAALHRAGEKPLQYGEQSVASGVAGADLLVEYEAKKATYLKQKEERMVRGEESNDSEMSEDEDGEEVTYEKMNDEVNSNSGSEGWVEVEESGGDEADDQEENEVAPTLVPVKTVNGKAIPISAEDNIAVEEKIKEGSNEVLDLSKMTREERAKLNQEISSTRVFTSADFEKMSKLVAREEKLKRDPRAAARLKRRRAQGKEFEELSDDESVDSDASDEGRVCVKGAASANDIMAEAKRKRANKMERLETILAGRDKFEHKHRVGGSTNTEKTRKKNFLMSKNSFANRTKQGSKETARRGTVKKTKKCNQNKHENKKRRRKL